MVVVTTLIKATTTSCCSSSSSSSNSKFCRSSSISSSTSSSSSSSSSRFYSSGCNRSNSSSVDDWAHWGADECPGSLAWIAVMKYTYWNIGHSSNCGKENKISNWLVVVSLINNYQNITIRTTVVTQQQKLLKEKLVHARCSYTCNELWENEFVVWTSGLSDGRTFGVKKQASLVIKVNFKISQSFA